MNSVLSSRINKQLRRNLIITLCTSWLSERTLLRRACRAKRIITATDFRNLRAQRLYFITARPSHRLLAWQMVIVLCSFPVALSAPPTTPKAHLSVRPAVILFLCLLRLPFASKPSSSCPRFSDKLFSRAFEDSRRAWNAINRFGVFPGVLPFWFGDIRSNRVFLEGICKAIESFGVVAGIRVTSFSRSPIQRPEKNQIYTRGLSSRYLPFRRLGASLLRNPVARERSSGLSESENRVSDDQLVFSGNPGTRCRRQAGNSCRRGRKSTNKKIRPSLRKSVDETELRAPRVLQTGRNIIIGDAGSVVVEFRFPLDLLRLLRTENSFIDSRIIAVEQGLKACRVNRSFRTRGRSSFLFLTVLFQRGTNEHEVRG